MDEKVTVLDLLRNTERQECLYPFSRDLIRASVWNRYTEVGANLVPLHPVVEAGLEGASKALLDGHILIFSTRRGACGHMLELHSFIMNKEGKIISQ